MFPVSKKNHIWNKCAALFKLYLNNAPVSCVKLVADWAGCGWPVTTRRPRFSPHVSSGLQNGSKVVLLSPSCADSQIKRHCCPTCWFHSALCLHKAQQPGAVGVCRSGRLSEPAWCWTVLLCNRWPFASGRGNFSGEKSQEC